MPLCSALRGSCVWLRCSPPACLPAPLPPSWETRPRLLALPGAAAAPRHLTALTCEGPRCTLAGWWSAWGCQQSVLCSCAWLGGRSHASPPRRWWGWHRHVRARPLQLEGWGAALELSSEPQWAGGLWGFGVNMAVWAQGEQARPAPGTRVSRAWQVLRVARDSGLGERGSWGGPRQGAEALVGALAGDSSPLRLSRVSCGLLGFHMALGSGATGTCP